MKRDWFLPAFLSLTLIGFAVLSSSSVRFSTPSEMTLLAQFFQMGGTPDDICADATGGTHHCPLCRLTDQTGQAKTPVQSHYITYPRPVVAVAPLRVARTFPRHDRPPLRAPPFA